MPSSNSKIRQRPVSKNSTLDSKSNASEDFEEPNSAQFTGLIVNTEPTSHKAEASAFSQSQGQQDFSNNEGQQFQVQEEADFANAGDQQEYAFGDSGEFPEEGSSYNKPPNTPGLEINSF